MARKVFFDTVNVKVDFPSMERGILKYWYEEGIVSDYLEKNKASKKNFSFLDGPITANNPMGVHHAWGRTYKDLWQRFYNMRGYKQRFQNGFDCQGLWIEVEVEKELGLKSKKEIESLVSGDKKKSIAKFVNLCKKRVYKFAEIQTDQSKRLGYFMDWDNSYYTLSDENNYMIWHFLKKCHEMGLIYKGRDSVPWCPRCGTAISQHEMLTEDYKEVMHQAIYVAYPIKGRENEHLLIWTTTPWTLPANIAVAVDKNTDYVLAAAKDSGKKYYLSQKLAQSQKLKVVKKVKGGELIGLVYESPFDGLPRVKKKLGSYEHRVVSGDERILPVTTEEGTGLVHVATGAGSEDFALGKKEKLPVIDVIDEEANYLQGLGAFSGKNAKDNPQIIISYLANKGFLYKKERYKHKYPACWRCKTELVWRVVDEWYIAIDPVRSSMKKVAKKIRWIPSFGLKRELDWLNNMHDWLISKKRYWGLALPIWECKNCGHFEVIGSKEELKEKAKEGWKKFQEHSPHRPWIDEVKISCEKCKSTSERIPDVGNPWLDAGIVSYSTITENNYGEPLYLNNKSAWRKWFPADFITESFPGQFKNWFYSLIAMSSVLEGKEPFKTVLGFATLLGEDGRPMHKSWGNAIEFNEGADSMGVDVMRWMYTRQNPADNLFFGYKVANEVRRKFHLKLWNVYNFFATYANLDEWKPSKKSKAVYKPKNLLDRWIILRLQETINKVSKHLKDYDAYRASYEIEEFVEDLSNWYLRRSRERVGPTATKKNEKSSFYDTLYPVLSNFVKILAPFTPYIADEIYTNLTKEKSVHLASWPDVAKLKSGGSLILENMSYLREIVEKAHSQRKKNQIPVRQPLHSIKVSSPKVLSKEYRQLLKEEINVHDVKWTKAKALKVRLDTKLTPGLGQEAKTRELIRKIQVERKDKGMNFTQKIELASPWLPTSKNLVQLLKAKTLSRKIIKGKFKISKWPPRQ